MPRKVCRFYDLFVVAVWFGDFLFVFQCDLVSRLASWGSSLVDSAGFRRISVFTRSVVAISLPRCLQL